jgi:drug/metabolite transporter (DMT)-like permease
VVTVDLPLDRRAIMVRGVGVIVLASVLFGTMAVCVQLAAAQMPAMQIAFVRFSGSLLVLLAFTRGQGLRPRAAKPRHLVLRGLLGAGAIVLYYLGIQGAGAGFATLLNCTYPVFTALFAAFLMGEHLSGRIGAALALNLVGVVVVLGAGAQVGPQVTLGGLSALAAAVLAGGAVATARHLRTTESASLITTYFMAVGVAVTAPGLLLGLPHVSVPLLLALAGVVLTSVAGQWLLHHGLGFASATQGSLAAATSVVTAAVLQAVVLGEHLGRDALIGGCLMFVAIGLAVSRE